ncbi:MAG: PspC domain-containing protein [Clostridiales bacterium]|nr:PspC domain-containing protein [Clostridiales bacterium]
MKNKMYLSETDKKISGVCGGIAEFFDIDSTLIRLAWVILSLFTTGFPGLIAYIIAALIIPKRQENV